MAVPQGVISWPGVISFESLEQCTISHGISPATIILKVHPQSARIAETGTLTFGSTGGDVVQFRDCKLDKIRSHTDGSGTIWSLEIFDRRWKWRDFGSIFGEYNQLDDHGKLIPWMIRSPEELIRLCLKEMGENNSLLVGVPGGLARQDGANWVANGVPPWGVTPSETAGTINPPVVWSGEPPAVALQRLCEQLGLVVVWQWRQDRVLITKQGIGNELPNGSIYHESPTLDTPETPTGGAVNGSPTRYQVRLLLEAVGEEWDGSYRPINSLSYAPQRAGAVQIVRIRVLNPIPGDRFTIFLNSPNPLNEREGILFEYTATTTSVSAVISDLETKINASTDPRIQGVLSATSTADYILITGNRMGHAWSCRAEVNSINGGSTTGTSARTPVRIMQTAITPHADWSHCEPPEFAEVINGHGSSTQRLTYREAVMLAQKSVFRCYRIADVGPTGRGPIPVPGYPYSPLVRRQQIYLLPTQVEQVVPEPRDNRIIDRNNEPITVNFYNGFSRDKPAAVYGSVYRKLGRAQWVGLEGINTDPESQVFVDFSVDNIHQMIVFNGYVYKRRPAGQLAGIEPASLILQTGIHVRNSEHNALEVFGLAKLFPGMRGNTGFANRNHPDVQLNVVGHYNSKNEVTGSTILGQDAKVRARYYLTGLEAQYIPQAAQMRGYNGILGIELDGAIAQVSWTIDGGGMSTEASRNTEHSIYVPPYPARRRAENLPAAEQANVVRRLPPSVSWQHGSMNAPGGAGTF